MKAKLKVFFSFALVLIAFVFMGGSVFAAESPIETQIQNEVTSYVNQGKLPSWHNNHLNDEGYQAYYYKTVHLSKNLTYFASLSEPEIYSISSWYRSKRNETWDYILEGLDIEPEYLEANKYLGIYWDSIFTEEFKDTGYLYLIWTSQYTPSEFVTLTEVKESGKIYKLYDTQKDADDLKGNWFQSDSYDYKDYNLTIHITPIGGAEDGKEFGLPLKQKYTFQGFTFGIDDAEWGYDTDPQNQFGGTCTESISFDLGLTPKQGDGKNAMQLVTHAYEIIKDCEVQSHFDLNFGGYIHYAMFNTTINIDKIYRVDVSYTITNDNKSWWQFFLPDDTHAIKKSLTCERVSGGIFGLSRYQGFAEGSYQSTDSKAKNYKYRLHLDYDADAWNLFEGKDYYESDYKQVSEFKILRMNYLCDGKVYDVAVKMDTVEGDTLNILDPDLILDTESPYYNFKKFFDDIYRDLAEKFDKYKYILYAVAGVVGTVFILWIVFKVKMFIQVVFGSGGNKQSNKRDE